MHVVLGCRVLSTSFNEWKLDNPEAFLKSCTRIVVLCTTVKFLLDYRKLYRQCFIQDTLTHLLIFLFGMKLVWHSVWKENIQFLSEIYDSKVLYFFELEVSWKFSYRSYFLFWPDRIPIILLMKEKNHVNVYLINVLLYKEMDQNNVLNFFCIFYAQYRLSSTKDRNIKTWRLTWYMHFQNTDLITPVLYNILNMLFKL